MSKALSAIAASFSLLALAGVSYLIINPPAASPETLENSPSQSLKSQIEDLQDQVNKLAQENRELSLLANMSSSSVKSSSNEDNFDSEDENTSGDENDGTPGNNEIGSRIAALETRVRSLEEDPIQRGFTYLESQNAELRKRGIFNLENLAKNDPEARQAIFDMLKDSDAGVRLAALDTLTDINDKEVIPYARQLLDDQSVSVQREAINTLTRLKDTEAAGDIAQFINSENKDLRRMAADSMGKLKYAESADLLLQALGDNDAHVRGQAISSLGEVGAKQALPQLRELYAAQNQTNPGRDNDHRYRIVTAMKQLGDRSGIDSEIDRLGTLALEKGNGSAMRSLMYLGRGEPKAKEYFQKISETSENEWLRREAKRMITGSGDRERSRRGRGRGG